MKTISALLLLLIPTCQAAIASAQNEEEDIFPPARPETSVEFIDQGDIRVTVSFDEERIRRSEKGEYNLVRLEMEGCDLEGKPGEPVLTGYFEDDSAVFGNTELNSGLGSGYRDILLWKLSE